MVEGLLKRLRQWGIFSYHNGLACQWLLVNYDVIIKMCGNIENCSFCYITQDIINLEKWLMA